MSEKKYKISEVYPNSPLVEVVCEVRFPGELAIECRRDEFYEKIRDRYPTILLPKAGDSLSPYRFENEGRTAEIMLAINRFSFHEKKYSGHKRFIKEFNDLVKTISQTYSLKKLARVGWRYINVIPFTREDGIVPLQRFISINVNLPEGMSDKFENVSIVFISKAPGGTITTRIESIIRSNDQQEALLMDFDFAMTEKISFSRINSCVSRAHEQTRAIFENLITDDYRQYLRGETI
jgi:uncharacterized protein (TIGR04255 family)